MLRSSKGYITKRCLQRNDFLYNFSNVNTITEYRMSFLIREKKWTVKKTT